MFEALTPRIQYSYDIDFNKYLGYPKTGGGKIIAARTIMNGRARYSIQVEGAKYGLSFGTALAIAISYTNNHSILWVIIHGLFSWLYVLYFALFRA